MLAEPGPIATRGIGIGSNPGQPSRIYAAADAVEGQIYLLELYPAAIGATRSLTPWGRPLAVSGIGVPRSGGSVASEEVLLRYSDAGYVSPPGGTMGSMYWEGRAKQALRLSRNLPVTPEDDRQVQVEIAGMDIENGDGALDTYVRDYSIDGRRVCIKFGMRNYAYEDFKPIFSGRAVGSWRATFDHLSLTARDESYRLNVGLQQSFYDGTGNIGGTSEMAGKPRPLTFGVCRNIAPTLVDPTNLIYQFHARAAHAVDAVYDRRAGLVSDGDSADYTALVAAVIATGHFKTCLSLGLFRLGSTPSGLVTADVKGDAQGSYINTTAAVIQRMMVDFVGLTSDQIDTNAFDAIESVVTGPIGWFSGTEVVQARDAISSLARGMGGWWGGTTDGLLTIGRLESPDPTQSTLLLESWDLINVSIVEPPPGTSPPRFRQRVSYARNWTVQRGEDLAGSVSAADRQVVAEPYSVVAASSNDALSDFLLAQDPPVLETYFDEEADAQAEADRLIGILGQQRQSVKVEIGYRGHLTEMGAMVSLQHPRINAGHRWSGRVIGQEPDANRRRATFTVWG